MLELSPFLSDDRISACLRPEGQEGHEVTEIHPIFVKDGYTIL